ncbi:MAG: dipeptidase [Planctomycetes bacterium]|nr:dipeptidase [Planctomycetota bacterium]
MKNVLSLAVLALFLAACASLPPEQQAQRIHASAPVFDGHNDLPGEIRGAGSSFERYDIAQRLDHGHTDIPRLRAGGVGAQFWSAYIPTSEIAKGTSARHCREQIELIRAMCARYPKDMELALTAADVERIRSSGRIAGLIGIEGGHAIENSLETLREFHALGARYMTLTHNDTLDWADAATDEAKHGGLTAFGEQVVREMNLLGMLVDISHVSADTMRDVLRVSTAPVIASHSSAFALVPHPRNVPDDVLRLVAKNGGVVMVNFAPGFVDAEAAKIFLGFYAAKRAIDAQTTDEAERGRRVEEWRKANPLPPVPFTNVADHIEHIARVAGVDHVGIGSDFDGIPAGPVGLEDVSTYPVLTAELLCRGWSERDVRKVLGANALRVLRACERVASELRASEARKR